MPAVLSHLRREGLGAEWRSTANARSHADGWLTVSWSEGGHAFPVVIKARLSPKAVPLLPRLEGGVVVTGAASPRLRDALTDAGWGYIDAAGNASLNAPGLIVRVEGSRPSNESTIPIDLPFSRTGLPVTFVLLARGGVPQAGTQREVAELAKTSLGSTNRVLQGLKRLGYLSDSGELLRRKMLVDRWTEAYLVLRDHLAPGRRFTSDRWPSAAKLLLDELPEGVHLSSEAAARAQGSSLRPETALVYCTPDGRGALIKRGRLRPDETGWVELRRTFWHPGLLDPGATEVPSFLVRADLLAGEDARLTAVAKEWTPYADV